MRPPTLQDLIDRAEAAIAASLAGRAAAKPAADKVFARLRATTGVEASAPAERLPVCDHLPAALAATHPTHRPVAEALDALAPLLHWARRRSATPDQAYFHGHANAMLAGPGGLESRDDLWLGVTLMAPGVTYPDHDHPPEETYLALTPGEWWNADMDWTDPGADGLIYNPPGILHSMRARPDTPFLALWFLPV